MLKQTIELLKTDLDSINKNFIAQIKLDNQKYDNLDLDNTKEKKEFILTINNLKNKVEFTKLEHTKTIKELERKIVELKKDINEYEQIK